MMTLIRSLWDGDLPLGEAFWWYAVGYGLVLNLVTSLLFLALLMKGASVIVLVLSFLLPVPYNLLVLVAVWRSAGRYPGPRKWADLARAGTLVWMVVLTAA